MCFLFISSAFIIIIIIIMCIMYYYLCIIMYYYMCIIMYYLLELLGMCAGLHFRIRRDAGSINAAKVYSRS